MKLKRITPVPISKQESDRLNKYVDVLVEKHKCRDPNDWLRMDGMQLMEIMIVMGAIHDMTKNPNAPHKNVKYEFQMFDDWSMLSGILRRSRFDDADNEILEKVLSFYPRILGFENDVSWDEVSDEALRRKDIDIMSEFTNRPATADMPSAIANRIAVSYGF